MIKFSVCYSNKFGSEFASASISDVELDVALFREPSKILDAIAEAYDTCEKAVHTQLGTSAALPDDEAAVPAAIAARMTPPPPAVPSPSTTPPASTPPAVAPAPNGRTYYAGRGQDGPPTTGKQLRQWAVKNGSLAWFEDFASKQTPALPKYFGDWSDEWARFAHATWLAACIPPAGPVPNGRPH